MSEYRSLRDIEFNSETYVKFEQRIDGETVYTKWIKWEDVAEYLNSKGD